MRRRIPHLLLVVAAAFVFGFAQDSGTDTIAPRIIIYLPDDIPPEVVWTRYALYGPEGSGRISRGETLKAEPNSRHYISAVFDSTPASYARVVIYAPGCQFATYDVDFVTGSDIVEQFHCDSLPTRTIHGFLRPGEIPSNTYLAEKKLDIAASEDADWICRFFFQPRGRGTMQGGSCLGSDTPLGTVGEIDPARGGKFEITIPDFTRDPVFNRFAEQGRFGVIELALKEKTIGRTLKTIRADDGPESGLNVQTAFPDPVTFTIAH